MTNKNRNSLKIWPRGQTSYQFTKSWGVQNSGPVHLHPAAERRIRTQDPRIHCPKHEVVLARERGFIFLFNSVSFSFFLFFRKNVWALCPNGYFMQGLRVNGKQVNNIEEGKCCHPQNHPDSYGHCYDKDVTYSFDKKGWSFCNEFGQGYYLTGLYKSDCNELYCIEKLKCCSMKKRNNTVLDFY